MPRTSPNVALANRQRRLTLGGLMAGLIALNLLWRTVRYALAMPIWGDEAFIIMNVIHRDFAGLIAPLEYGQVAGLLFMWGEEAVARLLGYSEWALRLPPFVCGVLSMLAFWRLARATLGQRAALLAVGFLAAAYYPVRHAAEVKPYAGDLLASIVLLWLAWMVYGRMWSTGKPFGLRPFPTTSGPMPPGKNRQKPEARRQKQRKEKQRALLESSGTRPTGKPSGLRPVPTTSGPMPPGKNRQKAEARRQKQRKEKQRALLESSGTRPTDKPFGRRPSGETVEQLSSRAVERNAGGGCCSGTSSGLPMPPGALRARTVEPVNSRSVGRDAWTWGLLIVFAAASVWASYPVVFVAGGVGLLLTALLMRQRSVHVAAGWLAYGICVGASFVAMYLLYAKPHTAAGWVPDHPETVAIWSPGFPPLREPWRMPVWLLDVHTGNMLAYPVGGKHGGSALTFIFVVLGVTALWRNRRDLLVLLLGPPAFTFVAAAMGRYPYGISARFTLHMAPTICLLAGVGLLVALRLVLRRRCAADGVRVAAIVLAVIAAVGIVRDVVKPYKTPSDRENRRVLAWLAAESRPSDAWISFNVPDPETTRGDDLYLRGGNGARHRYYLHRLAPGPLYWAPPFDALPPVAEGHRTWLIVYRDERAPFPEDRLTRYIEGLEQQAGSHATHRFTLDARKGEYVEIYAFGKPPGV
ncbi:MAG: glycosyltransferase family 39 protein [Phycisphaerae bacterium]|nr:glycosyltransferase family 39 protein [Phycisphaerae bacterium]